MGRKSGSHADITGPRVRAVACALFAQHGFAAVTMRQIGAAVGVEAGALYNYTRDKQSLLSDLLVAHLQQRLAGWDAAVHGDDPLEQLEAFCVFHIATNRDQRDAALIAAMELRNLTPDNLAQVETLQAQYCGRLENILRDGRQVGLFTLPDAGLAAQAAIALLDGLTLLRRDDGRLNPDRIERACCNMLRKAVGA